MKEIISILPKMWSKRRIMKIVAGIIKKLFGRMKNILIFARASEAKENKTKSSIYKVISIFAQSPSSRFPDTIKNIKILNILIALLILFSCILFYGCEDMWSDK